MPSFGKFLALTFSYLLLTVNLSLIRPIFAQEKYFFQEEFNEERSPGILNPDKWIVYPNQPTQPTHTGCLVQTVRETTGILLLKQCGGIPQFPYVVSKTNPVPNGDFTATIRFQFPGAGGLPTGIKFVDRAPGNGEGYTELFGVGFEEDVFQNSFRIEYKNTIVFSKDEDSGYYIFGLQKENDIYKIYFNNQLVFTSPPTAEKIGALYIGNPAILPSPGYGWSWPRVDYIRVIDNGPSEIIPEPFLDLPWDYNGDGLSFNEAATSINSYFDHEYPLLSSGLSEPSLLVRYFDPKRTDDDYSSHDGYDYGIPAEVNLGKAVLAAADGTATYMSSCTPCGNAILIDHGNGYQTRYYHMQEDGLIVSTPGESVEVTQGQQIGKVGFSGNVSPSGEAGSHLHFMVVRDKDGNGDFSDNIPDGMTDPFGWQSSDPDPWENYTFEQGKEQKTGSRSYYLFTEQLDNLNDSLTSNAKVFTVGKTKLEFPSGATNQSLNLTIKSVPNFTDLSGLNSLGSVILIEAKNQAGQSVTNFLKNFGLTINFSQFDLNRLKIDSLAIYSSSDGVNWIKEPTEIDLINKNATTSINHLTYIALMAERKDIMAPITAANLQGQRGTGNNFRSDVTLSLNPQDNPGGLGVEFTAYSIGEAKWQKYTTPLTFIDEGNHKIYFYSQDKDGNIEEIKNVEFSIDKTIPEAKIAVDLSDYDLKITPVSTDPVEVTKKPGKKLNEATYLLTDKAGNTLTLETYDLDSENKDIFKLYSLKYNSGNPIPVPANSLNTTYTFQPNPKRIRIISQTFDFGNQAKFTINADAFKNKTFLSIIENRKPRKEEKSGIVLLNLQTNKGKLEYSY